MVHSRMDTHDETSHEQTAASGPALFSIIVPTWNEAPWLPQLLQRFSALKSVVEIVVADNSSDDGTAAIARKAGCRVVTGGSPAEGRNAGARAASSDLLVFCDADAVFSDRALEAVVRAFEHGETAAIHFRLEPLGPRPFVRFCYRFMAGYFRFLQSVGIAQGVGTFFAVRASAFHAVGGFRTDLIAGEDADFFRRLGGIGNVKFDYDVTVATSSRRFDVEQPLLFAAKTCFWGLLRLFGSSASVLSYRWIRYPRELAERDCILAARFLSRTAP